MTSQLGLMCQALMTIGDDIRNMSHDLAVRSRQIRDVAAASERLERQSRRLRQSPHRTSVALSDAANRCKVAAAALTAAEKTSMRYVEAHWHGSSPASTTHEPESVHSQVVRKDHDRPKSRHAEGTARQTDPDTLTHASFSPHESAQIEEARERQRRDKYRREQLYEGTLPLQPRDTSGLSDHVIRVLEKERRTRSGSAFVGDNDKLYPFMGHIPKVYQGGKETYVIHMHGNTKALVMCTYTLKHTDEPSKHGLKEERERELQSKEVLNPEDLAELIHRTDWEYPQPVVLYACDTAQDLENGIVKQLAELLGVSVTGPSKQVWSHNTSDYSWVGNATYNEEDDTYTDIDPGEWRMYDPHLDRWVMRPEPHGTPDWYKHRHKRRIVE